MLAGVWTQVLKLDSISVDDNFFDLGGHSLLATQVISGIRKAFNVELPQRAIFDVPTVADLAVRITQIQTEKADTDVMARLVASLEELSDEEAASQLIEESPPVRRAVD